MKIRATVHTDYVGATHETVMEVPDDSSPEEIDETVQNWAFNHISIDWEEVE